MPDKVFISHSSKDKEIADAIRQHLESAGIPCWIAPRDIEPGADWTEGIMRGIANSRIFVLVFSDHANDSDHVRREVGRAFSLHLPVIPFRTEAIEPRDSLGYFLESVHWLDATKPPVERHLRVLTGRVKALLNGELQMLPHSAAPAKELKPVPKPALGGRRWLPAIGLVSTSAVIGAGIWFFVANHHQGNESDLLPAATAISPKSIAVLPFESLSADKEDTYFADGVQDDILNDLAKIAQLTVISRTSAMQYRAGETRDLRRIAKALGVANVLEGTVRRNANRVRVNTELIDAGQDKTIWADSFDRDLTDIFAIQSEIAQTIAAKLTATLSPEEKQNIEKKPTENLEAYDLYLRAKELLVRATVASVLGDVQKPLLDALGLLNQAIQLDPKFTLAYCWSVYARDLLYLWYDPTPEQRSLAEAAIKRALALGPDLPEVHIFYASHLYRIDHNYEQAREQLAIAKRGLPNDAEVIALEAYIDRRQGQWEKAIEELKDAIARDPFNPIYVKNLGQTLTVTRQFAAADQTFDRLIELSPDEPMVKVIKATGVNYYETGDDTAVKIALAAFPASMAGDRGVLSQRLAFALIDREWSQAKELIEKMNGGEDQGDFGYAESPVPIGCYSILLARLQGDQSTTTASFVEAREQLSQKVQKAPGRTPLLSQLAVVDSLLHNKETAITEAKQAAELLPISKDAYEGPSLELNLAVVYAWTAELDRAFETLNSLAKMPNGIFYGQLKRDPYWEPLRQDPRYEKLLAELAPHK
jgi:TolB-like protein/Tfp pilus assembly protein PilF